VTGVAVEAALELWASSLGEVKRRIRPLFSQERVAVSAGLFLDGLLGPERRKTGWMRAEAAGDLGPSPKAIPRRDSPQSGLKGGSRPSLAAAAGRPTRSAMWCATMWSRA
jgi:hypothetical protein